MNTTIKWIKVNKLEDSLTRVPILTATYDNLGVKLFVDTGSGYLTMVVGDDIFTTEISDLVVAALVVLKPEVAIRLATAAKESKKTDDTKEQD